VNSIVAGPPKLIRTAGTISTLLFGQGYSPRIDTWAEHLLGRIDEVLLTARMAAKRAVVRLWSVRIRDLVENEPGWRSTTSESRVRGA
jgi:hypothetical protein